jgi:Lrp/AsnC family transcriptional regulator
MNLDDTDRKILNLLQGNALLTIREIAEQINLSITPVHDRIKKLQREGIIERYVTLLNRKALGRGLTVYCFVTLDKQRQESFLDFNDAIRQMPEVLECAVVSGNFDYLLKVVVSDMEAYNSFYQSKLSVMKAVSHMSSSFVMEEVKSTTAIVV